ncbi:MAG: class I SAM-dependent methyltransferase, partial [Methanobacterium sp.]
MIKYIYRKYISLISKFYKNNIDGWTTEDELIWLLRTASSMDNVLEIGYWKGRSTHALATGCYGTVCTVDHFMGNVDERDNAHKEVKERQIFYDAKHNLKHFRNLVIINSYSFDASLLFKDKSIDMIFIDGC